jgi:hypothetical protein
VTKRLFVTLLALGGICACDKVGQEFAREVVKATSPEVKAPELKPVSEAEANEYAKRLLQAVEAGDEAAIVRAIDFDAIIHRALAGMRLPQRRSKRRPREPRPARVRPG